MAGKVVTVSDDEFDSSILNGEKPSLIDFWAEWCQPCKMLAPTVEELAGEYEGQAVIGKVNVDDNPEISAKYGIRNIPTILFIKNGEVVDKQVGAVPKSTLEEKIKAQL